MYKKVDTTLNFVERESDVLKFWQENRIFEKTNTKNSGDKVFTFYDGPPTANGRPGVHHVMARTLKDSVCRYKTMNGYQVKRKAVIVEEFIKNEILPLDERLSYRGIGLMWGIDCAKLGGDVFSKEVIRRCFDKQLIIERAGRDSSVVKIMPPLIISEELLKAGLAIVKEAFIETLNK